MKKYVLSAFVVFVVCACEGSHDPTRHSESSSKSCQRDKETSTTTTNHGTISGDGKYSQGVLKFENETNYKKFWTQYQDYITSMQRRFPEHFKQDAEDQGA